MAVLLPLKGDTVRKGQILSSHFLFSTYLFTQAKAAGYSTPLQVVNLNEHFLKETSGN